MIRPIRLFYCPRVIAILQQRDTEDSEKSEDAERIDMLIERVVVVELKVVTRLAPVPISQVLSYLRLADLHVGLLFNFNVDVLAVGGWKRVLRSR